MISTSKITKIFCLIDDFTIEFEKAREGHVLSSGTSKKHRNRKYKLSDSEVITILCILHLGQFRNLKHYYTNYVQKHLISEFSGTVSYNRFVELQQKAYMPMVIFLQTCCLGKCTGISYVDSTPIRVCHIKREKQHKALKEYAV